MRYNFTIRIWQDELNNVVLSSIQDIVVSDITIISKQSKFGVPCMHNKNRQKFGYRISLSKSFNKVSGSNSHPTLSFKGEFIDVYIKDFPRFPSFCQDNNEARNIIGGWGCNSLNFGFPHQLLYRKIEFLNITTQS